MPIDFKEQTCCGSCGAKTNLQILFFNSGLCDTCWSRHWQARQLKNYEDSQPQGVMARKA